MDYKTEYERWLVKATDADIKAELEDMSEDQVEDAFYRDLAFGTGGLRGTIGAGTNRMNVYVVAKASQGLAPIICSPLLPHLRLLLAMTAGSRAVSSLVPPLVCLLRMGLTYGSGPSFCQFRQFLLLPAIFMPPPVL